MKAFIAVTTILALGTCVFAEPPSGYNYQPRGGSSFNSVSAGRGNGHGSGSGSGAIVIGIPIPPPQPAGKSGPIAPFLINVPAPQSDGPPRGPAPIIIKLPPAAPSGKQLPQIIKLIQTPPKPAPPPPKPVVKLISFGKQQQNGNGGSQFNGGSVPSSQYGVPAGPAPSASYGAPSAGGSNQASGQAYKLVPVEAPSPPAQSAGFSPPPSERASVIEQRSFASPGPATSYDPPASGPVSSSNGESSVSYKLVPVSGNQSSGSRGSATYHSQASSGGY